MSETSMASLINFGGLAGACLGCGKTYDGFSGSVWRPLLPMLRREDNGRAASAKGEEKQP